MKIIVIGGTGLVGSRVVALLEERGHDARSATPASGVDTISGRGLGRVLEGAEVVVDVSNAPSYENGAAMEFFTISTHNLLSAEITAGVGHHVALSVVGAERLSESPYFRAKIAQEELIRESSMPHTIVHATQFFEFVKSIADAATDGETVRVAHAQVQPIASEEVAATVAEIGGGPPRGDAIEVAGPERFLLDQFIRHGLIARGEPRTVVAEPGARYFGAELHEGTLLPGHAARCGALRFQDWLARRPALA